MIVDHRVRDSAIRHLPGLHSQRYGQHSDTHLRGSDEVDQVAQQEQFYRREKSPPISLQVFARQFAGLGDERAEAGDER
jgi:hypothetical protein